MRSFLLRTLQAIVVVLGVSLAGFFVFQYIGDPVLAMVGQDTSVAERAAITRRLGLNDPLVVQYGRFLSRAAHGDFGMSYSFRRPVAEVLAERIPATVELVFVSGLMALAVAIPFGIRTAIHRNAVGSKLILAFSVIGVSIPAFLLGILLILLFSVLLPILPSYGRGETGSLFSVRLSLLTLDGWRHVLMPAVVQCLFQLGMILRLVRGEMLEVLRTDYIRFAWARGLSPRSIYYRHALKNTLVTVITAIGMQISALFAFSVITERVFQWPGMGQLLLQAIEFSDVPLLAAFLVLIGAFFALTNLLIDGLYYLVDPRMRG